jgi:hypothetical protein
MTAERDALPAADAHRDDTALDAIPLHGVQQARGL